MGSFMDSYYRRLREDYLNYAREEHPEKSFIYRHMQQEKNDSEKSFISTLLKKLEKDGTVEETAKKQMKKLMRKCLNDEDCIEGSSLEYCIQQSEEREAASFVEYCVQEVIDRSKANKRINLWLALKIYKVAYENGVKTGKEYLAFILEKKKGNAKFCANNQKLSSILKKVDTIISSEGKDNISSEAVRKIGEEALKEAMIMEIKEFFYDSGYTLKDETIPPRKKDRTLNMMEAYCDENNIFPFSTDYAIGADGNRKGFSEKDCEKLYKILSKGKNEMVLIPIKFSNMGTGLFIVGKQYFLNRTKGEDTTSVDRYEEERKIEQQKEACAYGIFEVDRLGEKEIELSYKLYSEAHTDFREANLEFESCIKADRKQIREWNQQAPKGCPEALKCFFAPDGIEDSEEGSPNRKNKTSWGPNLSNQL